MYYIIYIITVQILFNYEAKILSSLTRNVASTRQNYAGGYTLKYIE